jgi:hypothetical protein
LIARWQTAIEELLIKERLDLSPPLRELDAEIETVELDLRSLVASSLAGRGVQLPEHVHAKVKDRIRLALQKNPSLDPEHLNSIEGESSSTATSVSCRTPSATSSYG